jgi:hypothetical protein
MPTYYDGGGRSARCVIIRQGELKVPMVHLIHSTWAGEALDQACYEDGDGMRRGEGVGGSPKEEELCVEISKHTHKHTHTHIHTRTCTHTHTHAHTHTAH